MNGTGGSLRKDHIQYMEKLSKSGAPPWTFFLLLPNWISPEDIIHEAIILIYKLVSKKKIEFIYFKAYFQKVCKHLVLTQARKSYGYKTDSLDDDNDPSLYNEEKLMDTKTAKNMEEQIDYDHARKILEKHMEDASDLEEKVFDLHLEDYKNEEISHMLELDNEEVKEIVNRVNARLRARIKKMLREKK